MNANTSLAGPVVGALAGLTDRLTGRRLSILVFHRVLEKPDPLFPGEVDAQRFDTLMRTVAGGFTVLKLGDAVRHLGAGSLPARALVITFDDGYADNADVALPILARHGLTATFFVASSFLNGGRMWNDTIIESVRRTRRTALDLTSFGLGTIGVLDAEQRRNCIHALLQVVKYQEPAVRAQSLLQLAQLTGAPELPDDLMMTTGQLRHLHRNGMEIGGHTMGHPILKTLPDELARAEIQGGRDALQALIDAPIDVFAYPNGGPDQDYDWRHVRMVESLGFRGAVTTAHGAAAFRADPFQLPRYTPWGRNTAQWGARLVACRTRRGFQLASHASHA